MNERELQEIVARCVSTAVYYQSVHRTGRATDAMTSELRATALTLGEAGLAPGEIRARVVAPVRLELMARYGDREGDRIGRDIADAFAGDDPAEFFSIAAPSIPDREIP